MSFIQHVHVGQLNRPKTFKRLATSDGQCDFLKICHGRIGP